MTDAVPATRVRPEHDVPVRDARAEAALVVFEVVAHVELAEPAPDPALGMGVMQREVQHVVEQVPGEESGAGSGAELGAEDGDEERPEPRGERQREGGWENEPHGIVRVVVVDAVDHPVQAGAEPVLRLEMKDRAVAPVLAESPEAVAAGQSDEVREPVKVAASER